MKAYQLTAHGLPEVLKQTEIAQPKPESGEVLLKVIATSINPLDIKLRQHELPFSAPIPAILHGDVAGEVVEVGENTNRLKVGDVVYGTAGGVVGTKGGALAEFMVADERLLALKPETIEPLPAAALPLVTLTAWEALVEKMQVKKGENILVHAGAGGVGHVSVQLAVHLGLDVYTTVSNEKDAELVLGYGAKAAINYKKETVEEYVEAHTHGKGFDYVWDTVGGPNITTSLAAVKRNGHVASVGAIGEYDMTPLAIKAVTFHGVLMLLPMLHNEERENHGKILSAVAKLVDSGKIKPLLHDKIYEFDEVQDAHRDFEAQKTRGKVIIKIG